MSIIESSLLKRIIADQREEHTVPDNYLRRSQEKKLERLGITKEIVVITGMRRCGKSVLLQYIRENASEKNYYFNFEDERIANFTVNDFQTLQTTFIELFGLETTFYFDEIQNIPNWEIFVRRLYNAGNKIYITGSNANLFSQELGTRLTGRYVTTQIYPLSFYEYVANTFPEYIDKTPYSTTLIGKIQNLFAEFCRHGGIPEYIKHKQKEYLHSLYESILYRDIITRYKISNVIAIKKLVFFLASNCSKEMSYNTLKQLTEVGSASTIAKYCSHLEDSYLCFFVNRYSDSVKQQLQSPKKVYFVDHELARILGFRFSDDTGRMLENIVFIELKRRSYEVYYHSERKECDFIIRQQAMTVQAIQVCQHLGNPQTKKREFSGLLEALDRFSLSEGLIITENTEAKEIVTQNDISYQIHIVPIWKWLLQIKSQDLQ